MNIGVCFLHRPRAASGEIASKAMERLPAEQPVADGTGAPPVIYAAITAFFRDPDEDTGRRIEARAHLMASAAKRPRVETPNMESVRLRHIVVRHKECKYPLDP